MGEGGASLAKLQIEAERGGERYGEIDGRWDMFHCKDPLSRMAAIEAGSAGAEISRR
jgi:hypothetical protein